MDFESYETRRAAWLTANGLQARSGRDGIGGAACRLTAAGRAVHRRASQARRAVAAQRTASAPASCPMANFLRSRLVAAAGGRVALRTVLTLWENMMLGAVQGVVYDADGSVIVDWFSEWGIAKSAPFSMGLDDPAIVVEGKARAVLRGLIQKSAGNWTADSYGMAMCGDDFFDALSGHKSVRETFLNTADAQLLNRAFGVAGSEDESLLGSTPALALGGIVFTNYRGVDDFDDNAAVGSKAGLGIKSDEARVFPVNVPGAFQKAFAPGEGFESVNTIGLPMYSLMLRDEKRNFWVRPEVYSYPLFICTRPEMLLTLTI